MKPLFWVVLIAVAVLTGYLVWGRAHAKSQPGRPPVAFEVGAESVAAYGQRVAELEARVAALKKRLEAAGKAERREVKARLAEFEHQMSELKRAIAQWQVARGGDAPNEAYHQCLLIYGRARGVCDALAPDTLVGK